MTCEELDQKVKELKNIPITERPKYKALLQKREEMVETCRKYFNPDIPVELEEARIRMLYRIALQHAAEEDSQDYLSEIRRLLSLTLIN